jgi:hypothetical protein
LRGAGRVEVRGQRSEDRGQRTEDRGDSLWETEKPKPIHQEMTEVKKFFTEGSEITKFLRY